MVLCTGIKREDPRYWSKAEDLPVQIAGGIGCSQSRVGGVLPMPLFHLRTQPGEACVMNCLEAFWILEVDRHDPHRRYVFPDEAL